jgi:pSer/pThr/pTyr-binding forkhead associated (FHA) protein
VSDSPIGPHAANVTELRAQIEAERAGYPFLVLRDGSGAQRIVLLEGQRLTVGRHESADLAMDWDDRVSRLHAQLEPMAADWVLADDGLSRNGSYVNGERIMGRQRLRDGDLLRFGSTHVAFRNPAHGRSRTTKMASVLRPVAQLSVTQRNVLIALCRPYKDSPGFASPASNQQVAQEVSLSVDAVKAHLRTLFEKFALTEVPQSEKRVRLVEAAFNSGSVSEHDI